MDAAAEKFPHAGAAVAVTASYEEGQPPANARQFVMALALLRNDSFFVMKFTGQASGNGLARGLIRTSCSPSRECPRYPCFAEQ